MKASEETQAATAEGASAEYDDDALAEMSDAWAKEAERLGRLARGAHAELLARLLERGATILDTPHWSGRIMPGVIHHTVDDPERFHERLMAWVSGRDLATAFVYPPPPSMRVDHRGLNELHKLGGSVAQIIEEERRSVRGESQLVLTRKEAPPV